MSKNSKRQHPIPIDNATMIEIREIKFRIPADTHHRFALWILKMGLTSAVIAYVWHEISRLF
jgi:hypothetical protein